MTGCGQCVVVIKKVVAPGHGVITRGSQYLAPVHLARRNDSEREELHI